MTKNTKSYRKTIFEMMKTNITLGIINPSDFSNDEVFGGSSGFLVNILPYLNMKKTVIFGIGFNKTIPWKTYPLDRNVDFIPICKLKFPSKIPMRLKGTLLSELLCGPLIE